MTTYLLAKNHNLESIKVGQVGALCLRGLLLGPRGLLPLSHNVVRFPSLLDSSNLSSSGNGDLKICESKTAEINLHAGDAGHVRGAVDQSLVLIDNVDDGAQFSFMRTIVDDADASDFYETFEYHF